MIQASININGIYLETGFDMALFVQNMEEKELLDLCKMSQLHVLRKWEHCMWD